MPAGDHQFGLYLSSIEGKPVTRFGTKVLIGAVRVGNRVFYQPKVINPIPIAETKRYHREYRRAISAGSVVSHTREQWLAQQSTITAKQAAAEKLATSPEVGAPPVTARSSPNDHPQGGSK